jgi:hypothetical protein
MNNPMRADSGSRPGAAMGAAAINARVCGTPMVSAGAEAETAADPIIRTHSGSEQSLVDAAGPVTTPRDTTVAPESPESAHATHGEAIIAPAPNATANAPTRPT